MTGRVVDASAVVDFLLYNEHGRAVQRSWVDTGLYSVAHLDAEVLSALARLQRDAVLTAKDVEDRLSVLADLPVERLPISGALTAAAWRLRDNVAIRDALYVALAAAAGMRLLTTDRRLARAVPDVAVLPG